MKINEGLLREENNIKLIVGLGNPGIKYKNTRHNLGATVVDRITKVNNLRLRTSRSLKSRIVFCEIEKISCLLAFPQGYMNCSGEVLKNLIRLRNFALADILVIYDDLDLELGTIRFKRNGSSAGHRGIQSIIDILETKEFNRLRLGIGKPEDRDSTVDYVLSEFSKSEINKVNSMIRKSIDACRFWVKYGIEKSMNKFN